jgi:hypothetical protein
LEDDRGPRHLLVGACKYLLSTANTFSCRCKYFNTFIDILVEGYGYYFTYKPKYFSIFKRFKVIAEKQSGCFLKVLHTNKGGEFISHEFQDFCKEIGIKRKLTTSYAPQLNRVVECKNKTWLKWCRA